MVSGIGDAKLGEDVGVKGSVRAAKSAFRASEFVFVDNEAAVSEPLHAELTIKEDISMELRMLECLVK